MCYRVTTAPVGYDQHILLFAKGFSTEILKQHRVLFETGRKLFVFATINAGKNVKLTRLRDI